MKVIRLNDASNLLDHIDKLNELKNYAILDAETTDKDPKKAKLIDIQLSSYEDGNIFIFGVGLSPQLVELNVPIVAHNYKYDAHVLYRQGIDLLNHEWIDTMLVGHLLDENRESYSLDSYVKELWQDNYKEEFWSKYDSYESAPKEEREEYACKDIFYTDKLWVHFKDLLKEHQIPDSLLEHTHRLSRDLLSTEIQGIQIDKKYLHSKGIEIKSRIEGILPKMYESCQDAINNVEYSMWLKEKGKRKTAKGKLGVPRPEFNFESSKQLQDLLYRELYLEPQKNESTKQISTDYEALQKLKGEHPVIELIQENRELTKVYTSYINGTLDRMKDGRIYPEFRVNGTVTGRLASANPNMQQLPREGGIRGIYIPECGNKVISADYSSLEIVLAANLTEDPNLVRIVKEGISMHDITAQNLKIDRNLAKTLNFAEGYGCTPFKVARILGVSQKEATYIHNRYWETYAGQKRVMEECRRKVDSGEPIITPFGRRRRFAVMERRETDRAYRQAWNFLVQSTGADCTNRAFYLFGDYLREKERGRCWFPVHDEIIGETYSSFAQEDTNVLCSIMEQVGDEIGLKYRLKAHPTEPADRWTD